MTPTNPIRPGWGRVAAILALGPPIGTAALFLAQSIIDQPPPFVASELLSAALFLLSFGYLFGLLPAASGALAYSHFYSRLTTRWRQFFACVGIGAVSGGIGVLLPVWVFAGSIIYEPQFMALSAIAGAVALPLTAMPLSPRP